MDCRRVKKLIPIYLDGQLEAHQYRLVEEHLKDCLTCRAEARALEKSWKMLGELREIEPDPNYLTRFWETVSAQTPWHEKILGEVSEFFFNRRIVPALTTVGIILMVSLLGTYKYLQKPEPEKILAELNEVDLEMVEYIDLAENYDIIREIEFLSDLEIIESLDEFGTS